MFSLFFLVPLFKGEFAQCGYQPQVWDPVLQASIPRGCGLSGVDAKERDRYDQGSGDLVLSGKVEGLGIV